MPNERLHACTLNNRTIPIQLKNVSMIPNLMNPIKNSDELRGACVRTNACVFHPNRITILLKMKKKRRKYQFETHSSTRVHAYCMESNHFCCLFWSCISFIHSCMYKFSPLWKPLRCMHITHKPVCLPKSLFLLYSCIMNSNRFLAPSFSGVRIEHHDCRRWQYTTRLPLKITPTFGA